MPKRGIDYCMDVMDFLKRKGMESEAPAADVLKAIHLCAGMEQRTRDKYMTALRELGFIEPKGNGVFALHFEKVYELSV